MNYKAHFNPQQRMRDGVWADAASRRQGTSATDKASP
jgi:arginyl-tRNA--protein-N-Asp/Glu arginylyltransferase